MNGHIRQILRGIQRVWSMLEESFSRLGSRDTVFLMLYDLLLYAGVYLMAAIWNKALTAILNNILGSNMESAIDISSQSPQIAAGFFQQAVVVVMISLVLLMIATLALYSISKSLVWSTIFRKRLTARMYVNFCLLNLIWIPAMILVTYFLMIATSESFKGPAVIIAALLAVHLTSCLNYLFFVNGRILFTIRKALSLGFSKIHLFLAHYVIILIVFVAAGQIPRIFTFLPEGLSNIGSLVLMLLFTIWSRLYFAQFAKSHLSG